MSFLIGTPNTLTIYGATFQSTTANPSGTTSTTAVMMGLAGSIVPVISGRIYLSIKGSITNATSADGATVQCSYGTGSAPSNAGALAGTQIGSIQTYTAPAASGTVPFHVSAVITGLTLGMAYWLDAAVKAVTGGTATITNVTVSAFEM